MQYHADVTAVWPSASPTSSALAVPFTHATVATVAISGAWTNAHVGLQREVYPGVWFPFIDQNASYTGVSIQSASGNVIMQAPAEWFVMHGNDHQVVLWSHDGTGNNVQQGDARTVVLTVVGK